VIKSIIIIIIIHGTEIRSDHQTRLFLQYDSRSEVTRVLRTKIIKHFTLVPNHYGTQACVGRGGHLGTNQSRCEVVVIVKLCSNVILDAFPKPNDNRTAIRNTVQVTLLPSAAY
jgi:hypothetical protein